MNSFNSHQEAFNTSSSSTNFYTKMLGAIPAAHPSPSLPISRRNVLDFFGVEDKAMSAVIPPVTVVFDGRSICQRIHLHKHSSYHSLARALRQMFVDVNGDAGVSPDSDLCLSNAIPGHLIAYEDMEGDLLLAGDLHWKDFVRVARRIRIIPVKVNPRRVFRGP
ncbi:auxin-responsive protein IAA33 [Cinnamomum micranthum f. kanehirae]|uniref:Auxin-responsive protein n=1 Tax=Cinnamomum micranthum f. kanehirae TaxID=337451 RepID=A0A3S3NFW1_9MAGN|nr:auxin-responsive protein IAA33 [Cinnamomum micranthum f. kanehirae]